MKLELIKETDVDGSVIFSVSRDGLSEKFFRSEQEARIYYAQMKEHIGPKKETLLSDEIPDK